MRENFRRENFRRENFRRKIRREKVRLTNPFYTTREYSFSLGAISKIMSVHLSTIWREVNEYPRNVEFKYSDINDEDLDQIIVEIKKR